MSLLVAGGSAILPFTPSSVHRSSFFLVRQPAKLPTFPRFRRASPRDLTCFSSPSWSTTPCALHHFNVDGGALLQDAGATSLVLAGAYCLVSAFDYLTTRNVIKQNVSRKLVHILSGLLFLFSWPLFSATKQARYFAALVPLVNCLRLVVHGLSLVNDERLVKSVTREGNPEELLKGPLCYVMVLILCAIIFWRESPVGVISLAMMCGGDGIADIMGRRYGVIKIPYNQQKSWVGSIFMFLLGFLVSIGMLYYFSALGYFHLDWVWTAERVALVALIATLVESLPITQVVDDNLSVPLSTMLMASLFFS